MAKIMQINITCGRGSTGDIAARLYRASEKAGYEARFAYAAFTPTIESAFRIENSLQHYGRRALNRYFGRRQRHSTPGTKRLIRYIKRERPDLIHVHNIQQNAVNYLAFFDYLRQSGIPVVFTLHDCWSFTGGCYHFFKRGCEKYATGNCGGCTAGLDDVAVTVAEAYAHKRALIGGNDNIHPVCVSRWLQSAAEKSYMGEMKHPPAVIHNGVDTGVFRPTPSDVRERLHIEKDAFMILGVAGYWNEDKGLAYFEKLSESLPAGYRIVLVGHGLEASQAKYGRLACLPPTDSREKLAALYTAADVYVNLSCEETFGLTTAEALASGTPAVVFDTTACSEVIDGHTGECVHYQNDTDADIRAVISAIENIKEKGKMSYTSVCVERVKQHFTTEQMTDSYLSLYRSVLRDNSKRKDD